MTNSKNYDVISLIIERFSYFGELPLCNLNIDRAIIINGFVFPLCARCTGLFLGLLLGSIFYILFQNKVNKLVIVLSLLFIPVTIIDGVAQYCFNIISTNPRRIITGFLSGFGFIVILLFIVTYLTKKIFKKSL